MVSLLAGLVGGFIATIVMSTFTMTLGVISGELV